MFGALTRWIKRKPAKMAGQAYVLPSDDPELNPVTVLDDGDDVAASEASIDSPLAANGGDASGSARTRAVAEVREGLGELGAQLRALGQRIQAQTMGQAKLLEALAALPALLREATPGGAAQVLEQVANRVEAGQRETALQVRALVEGLAAQDAQRAAQVQGLVEQMARTQRTQVRQQIIALRAGRAALASQRNHQEELERAQQGKLNALQHENAQNFFRMEERARKSGRQQLAVTAAAALVAIAALAVVVASYAGAFKDSPVAPPPQAERERVVTKDAMLQK